MSLFAVACAAIFLLSDTSGSVKDHHYRLMQEGTAAAFENPDIHIAISRRPLAVAYAEFDTTPQTRLRWRVLTSAADARAFAAELRGLPRVSSRGTNTGAAIGHAINAFDSLPCDATERTIDIVSDGDSQDEVTENRDRAAERGIRINGLAVTTEFANPEEWIRENVITPETTTENGDFVPAGFVISAQGWHDFAIAFRRKLILEQVEWRPVPPGEG